MALTAGFENGVVGDPILTSDPGDADPWDSLFAVVDATITYSDAQAFPWPGKSMRVATGATSEVVGAIWDSSLGGSVVDHYGRMFVYLPSVPATPVRPFRTRQAGSTKYNWEISITGVILAQSDATVTVGTGVVPVAINSWFRVEHHFIHGLGDGSIEVRLFNDPTSNTPDEIITSPSTLSTSADIDSMQVGNWQSSSFLAPFWIDGVVANETSWPGPIVDVPIGFPPTIFGRGAA